MKRALGTVPPLMGNLDDMIKKGFRYGNLIGGSFTAKEYLESGGRFIYWGLQKMYEGGLQQRDISL